MTDTSDTALDATSVARNAAEVLLSGGVINGLNLEGCAPHLARNVIDWSLAIEKLTTAYEMAEAEITAIRAERDAQQAYKDAAYLERNKLVALLAAIFPAGTKRTAIEGWSDDWHGCVYIDFPWGQASWHYHDSQEHLFAHLPPYQGEWDGHTTDEKYAAIVGASRKRPTSAVDHYMRQIGDTAYARGVHAALAALESSHSWMEARDAIRSLADPPPAPQCCMCGKKGLSTVEGDGGPECQLDNGRWVCSAECYDRAYPDTPPAPAVGGGG